MTKKNLGLISFLKKLFSPSEKSYPTAKKSMGTGTGNREWIGEDPLPQQCDISGLGGQEKKLIQNQDLATSPMLSPTSPFLQLIKNAMSEKILAQQKEYQEQQNQNPMRDAANSPSLPCEWIRGDFVHCCFIDQFTFQQIDEFGFIESRINDYYVIKLLSGKYATMPFESIRVASRA